MHGDKMEAPNVFLSYSHRDEEWKDRLISHLRSLERQGMLDIWDTSDLPVGSDWSQEIQQSLKKADLAILLVSPDFLASDFIIQRELPALLRRREKEGLAVLPIIVRPAAWSTLPELAQLQFLNTDARPLAALSNYERDQVLTNISERIAEIAGAIRERASSQATVKSKKPKLVPPSDGKKPSIGEYFISHSRANGDFAELLQLELEKEGYTAWIDTNRLSAGVDWREEIDDAIRRAMPSSLSYHRTLANLSM